MFKKVTYWELKSNYKCTKNGLFQVVQPVYNKIYFNIAS